MGVASAKFSTWKMREWSLPLTVSAPAPGPLIGEGVRDRDLSGGERDRAGEPWREVDLVRPRGRVGAEDRLPEAAWSGVRQIGDRERGGRGALDVDQGQEDDEP